MYVSTVGILVILVIFLGLLFLFTPWLYRPYLDLLEAREALEDPSASASGDRAVERLEKRVQAKWDSAQEKVSDSASSKRSGLRRDAQARVDEASRALLERAQSEEAELEKTIESARVGLEGEVKALADELVAKALGRSA
jgi:F0F1-type ATP synthase membrane subunit b/b'